MVTKKKIISIMIKDFLDRYFVKLMLFFCFALAAFLGFIFLKEYLKLEPITDEEKSHYSSIAKDIWVNGLSSLEDENIQKIKVTYISNDLHPKNDNSFLVYSKGLSTLDYDNTKIYIEFDDFFVEQSSNVIKFTRQNEDKFNTKFVYSNDDCNITYNNKPDGYYMLLVTDTLLICFAGGFLSQCFYFVLL